MTSFPETIMNGAKIAKNLTELTDSAWDGAQDSTYSASSCVYLNNLPYSLTDQELLDFMSDLSGGLVAERGNVARIENGRSKGYALVYYSTEEDALAAIAAADGAEMNGRTVYARLDRGKNQPAEGRAPRARKERARAPRGGGGKEATGAPCLGQVVYAGNLPFAVTEEELKQAFAAYSVLQVELKYGFDGRPRGWALLHFLTPEAATLAIRQMNNVDLAGRPLILKEDRKPQAE